MNVRLRAMEPEDLDLLYHIENDETLWKVGSSNVPYSRYALHNYIASSSYDIYVDRQVRLMAENEEGRVVGIADLVNFDPRNCRAELGLVIIPEERQKGYASAVLDQIADYAQRQLHLRQLYAFISTDNKACISLFRQREYQCSSVLHDWLYDGHDYHDAVLFQIFL